MADTPKLAALLSDREADADLLDFKPYTETLLDIVRDPHTAGPLVIGLFGTWGSGKTSLMRFVEKDLRAPLKNDGRVFRVAWFDAWKYEKEEALWRALLLRVIDELRDRDAVGTDCTPEPRKSAIERLEQRLYREVEWEEKGGLTVDWPTLVKEGVAGAVKLSFAFVPGLSTLTKAVEAAQGKLGEADGAKELLDAFHRDVITHHQAQLRSIEQFQVEFGNLIRDHVMAHDQRLVVFVDDLDRCLPEKAIEVLEAIKLFLDVPGCIFMLGLDQEVVTRGIKVKYRDFGVDEGDGKKIIPIDGANYLEKIIQLPFRLPRIEPHDMTQFVGGLATFPDPRCAEVFAEGLETNPRKVKRAINIFLFISRLADRRAIPIKPVRLAKIVVIYHSHQPLYERLRQQPSRLRDLENYYRKQRVSPEREQERGPGREELAGLERAAREPAEPPPVDVTLLNDSLKRVLTLFPDDADACFGGITDYQELDSYFTLTRGTIAQAVPVVMTETASRAALSFPVPTFVRIPAGEFRMGTTDDEIKRLLVLPATKTWAKEWLDKGYFKDEQPSHSVMVDAFEMARYPVTNAEYQAFVKATNQKPPGHWSGLEFPDELAAHPVVNVNWDDAVAYCAWLTEQLRTAGQLREGGAIRLPTEAEWEKAAVWDDDKKEKRFWAWGNQWDASKCNTAEGNAGTTTPVGKYSPAGDSFYSLADMAGNVWEWCSSLYKPYPYKIEDGRENPESRDSRILRGGSWLNGMNYARGANRYWGNPGDTYNRGGFRCARSSG
ncbi:MAG: SUMF1/EgtB/PvdO family nonheme iron enzyme [Anaerolineae bacterium]